MELRRKEVVGVGKSTRKLKFVLWSSECRYVVAVVYRCKTVPIAENRSIKGRNFLED